MACLMKRKRNNPQPSPSLATAGINLLHLAASYNKAYKLRRSAPWPAAHCGKSPPQRLICLNVI